MNTHQQFDELLCKRVGSLSAHGMDDRTIADILLVTLEDVAAIKLTEAYRNAHSEKLTERVESAIDREEGWDSVEAQGIEKVLASLKHSHDPKFALAAAAIANKAVRRSAQPNKVLDATRTNKMIILTMNKKFIDGKQVSETSAAMAIEDKVTAAPPRRSADLPTPKTVAEMLKVAKEAKEIKYLEADQEKFEMQELAERHGIDASLLEDE